MWWRPGRTDEDFDQEIQAHLSLEADRLISEGMSPEEARAAASRRFGNVVAIKEWFYESCRIMWLDHARQDLRYAIRGLLKSPSFTAVAVLTLALGIGANTAIFSMADAALIRPLPFSEPEQLVMLWERPGNFLRNRVAPLNFLDWSEQNRTFHAMAAVATGGGRTMPGADGAAEYIPAQGVTARFFDVLGVRPIAGRTFLPDDATLTPNAVVISERFWSRHFASDPALVGHDIRLDGRSFTVVGIVPAAFQILGPSDLWTLLSSPPRGPEQRRSHYLRVIGRLKPGVTLEVARIDMAGIAEAIARMSPATNQGWGVTIEPLRDALIGSELRLTALLLFGVVGFVLMMSCANVTNLLLARTAGRARELAVRAALGAGRRRIVVQLLTESLVLAAVGGLMGLSVGAAILTTVPSVIPQGLLPEAVTLTFDGRVVAFCAATTCLVGVLFGLVPAWQTTRMSPTEAMGTGGRGVTTRGGTLRSALVVGEVAAAVLLLCGAGLLLRTLLALENVDPGYRADDVLTMAVTLPTSRYPTPDHVRRFHDAVERDVTALPGVRSAAWGSALPLDGRYYGQGFEIVGEATPLEANRPAAAYQMVSAPYFDTLGIPIVRGRSFTDRDTAERVQVCIVSEAFVQRYLQGREPVGMHVRIRPMRLGPAEPVVREIVGVARQVKEQPGEVEDPVQIYVPIAQNPWFAASLVVQPTDGAAEALAPAVRAAVAGVDTNQPVTRVRTLEDVARDATSRPRFRAVLVVAFAALALVLATLGVFGVLAYSVQQRAREFGVRIALGASAGSIMRVVLARGALLTAVGLAIGLALAWAGTRTMQNLLYRVTPGDPATFVAVIAGVGIIALLACYVPARRATKVDPLVALRSE